MFSWRSAKGGLLCIVGVDRVVLFGNTILGEKRRKRE
jgi:hypothetical protein